MKWEKEEKKTTAVASARSKSGAPASRLERFLLGPVPSGFHVAMVADRDEGVAAILELLPIVHTAPPRLLSSYQLLGAARQGDVPGEPTARLRDLFVSQLSHGQLLDRVHALRNVEKPLKEHPDPAATSSAMASLLEALDTGVCGGVQATANVPTNTTAAACSKVRRALMLDRVAFRKEQCDWRQHEAELSWLREITSLGLQEWAHTVDPSLLLTFPLPPGSWRTAMAVPRRVSPPSPPLSLVAPISLGPVPTSSLVAGPSGVASLDLGRRSGTHAAAPLARTESLPAQLGELAASYQARRTRRVGFVTAHCGPTRHVLFLLQRATYDLDRRWFETHLFCVTVGDL